MARRFPSGPLTTTRDNRGIERPVASPAWNSPNAIRYVAAVDAADASPAADASACAALVAVADEVSSTPPRICESALCANPDREFPPVRPVPASRPVSPVALRCSRNRSVVVVVVVAAVPAAAGSTAVATDAFVVDFVAEDCCPIVDIVDVARDTGRASWNGSFLRVHPIDSRPRTLHRTCHIAEAGFLDWWNLRNWCVPVENVVDVGTDGNANNSHRHYPHPHHCYLPWAVMRNGDGAICRPDRSA